MDVAALILHFLADIAWPAVVLLVLLMYRRPLRRLLEDADELTAFGATVKRTARAVHDFKELAMTTSDSHTAAPAFTNDLDLAEWELLNDLTKFLQSDAADPYTTVIRCSDAIGQAMRLVCNLPLGPQDELIAASDLPADLKRTVQASWNLRQEMVTSPDAFDHSATRDYAAGAVDTVKAIFAVGRAA